jgi:glycerophosphoryl diester phosphodiesterase
MRLQKLKHLGLRGYLLSFALIFFAIVYLLNASWLAPEPDGRAALMAHRGIHQLYDREGIGNGTCTAQRMEPPINSFLENTIPSMRASFDAGADILELDVHPTTDDQFVVFHDWTIDCRTEGSGVTRDHSLAYLQTLDVGWGYTADGGKSFPFRGKGGGMMPSLAQVLKEFPDRKFLINFKSRWIKEADHLLAYLERNGIAVDEHIMVYGGPPPVERWKKIHPGGFAFTKADMKRCTFAYFAYGWSSIIPETCKNSTIGVPLNFRYFVWGWPNRFLQRMEKAGATVIIMGDVTNDNGAPGITDPADLASIPEGFKGLIWTDAIGEIGPAWNSRGDDD